MARLTDEQRKVIAITAMAENFNRSLSDAAIKMFVASLKDVPASDVERAATQAVSTCEFMPVPAKIRELAGVGGTKVEDRAILAWMAVERAVASLGAYRSVDFDDKIINAAIRAQGGWAALCARSGEDFDIWAKKDFLASYAILVRSGASPEMLAPLQGLGGSGPVRTITGEYIEHTAPTVEVQTGLPWAGDPVRRLGQSTPRQRAAAPPMLELKKPE